MLPEVTAFGSISLLSTIAEPLKPNNFRDVDNAGDFGDAGHPDKSPVAEPIATSTEAISARCTTGVLPPMWVLQQKRVTGSLERMGCHDLGSIACGTLIGTLGKGTRGE